MKKTNQEKFKEKIFAVVTIFLMISVTFAASFSLVTPTAAAQAKGCCVKTISNGYCVSNSNQTSCQIGKFKEGLSCSSPDITECQIGTCKQADGSCDTNYTRAQCEDQSLPEPGYLSPLGINELSDCQPACCAFKSNGQIIFGEWVNYKGRCDYLSTKYNLDYDAQSLNYQKCSELKPLPTEGYCRTNEACVAGTLEKCQTIGGEFSSNPCPQCKQNATTKCSNGDVYWADSCGIKGELNQTCPLNTQICKEENGKGQCVNMDCKLKIIYTNLAYDTAYFKAGQVRVLYPQRWGNDKLPQNINDIGTNGEITLKNRETACVQYQGPGEGHYIYVCNGAEAKAVGEGANASFISAEKVTLSSSREYICDYDASGAYQRKNNYSNCSACYDNEAGITAGWQEAINWFAGFFDLGNLFDFKNLDYWGFFGVGAGLCDQASTCHSMGDCIHGSETVVKLENNMYNDCVPKFAPASGALCAECMSTQASSPWRKCWTDEQCRSRGNCEPVDFESSWASDLTICAIDSIASTLMGGFINGLVNATQQTFEQATNSTKEKTNFLNDVVKATGDDWSNSFKALSTFVGEFWWQPGEVFNFFGLEWTPVPALPINEQIAQNEARSTLVNNKINELQGRIEKLNAKTKLSDEEKDKLNVWTKQVSDLKVESETLSNKHKELLPLQSEEDKKNAEQLKQNIASIEEHAKIAKAIQAAAQIPMFEDAEGDLYTIEDGIVYDSEGTERPDLLPVYKTVTDPETGKETVETTIQSVASYVAEKELEGVGGKGQGLVTPTPTGPAHVPESGQPSVITAEPTKQVFPAAKAEPTNVGKISVVEGAPEITPEAQLTDSIDTQITKDLEAVKTEMALPPETSLDDMKPTITAKAGVNIIETAVSDVISGKTNTGDTLVYDIVAKQIRTFDTSTSMITVADTSGVPMLKTSGIPFKTPATETLTSADYFMAWDGAIYDSDLKYTQLLAPYYEKESPTGFSVMAKKEINLPSWLGPLKILGDWVVPDTKVAEIPKSEMTAKEEAAKAVQPDIVVAPSVEVKTTAETPALTKEDNLYPKTAFTHYPKNIGGNMDKTTLSGATAYVPPMAQKGTSGFYYINAEYRDADDKFGNGDGIVNLVELNAVRENDLKIADEYRTGSEKCDNCVTTWENNAKVVGEDMKNLNFIGVQFKKTELGVNLYPYGAPKEGAALAIGSVSYKYTNGEWKTTQGIGLSAVDQKKVIVSYNSEKGT